VVFVEDFSGLSMIRNDNGEASAYLDQIAVLEKQALPANQFNEMIDDMIAKLKHRSQPKETEA
jgi:hypothetical protein